MGIEGKRMGEPGLSSQQDHGVIPGIHFKVEKDPKV